MIHYKGLITIMLLLFLFVLTSHCREDDPIFASGELRCKPKEREALLRFKKGLIDEYGFLSSWGSEEDKRECCDWKGIKCSNLTGHVISLQLWGGFRGKINSALLELSYLNNLDLSGNDFGNDLIPKFIGSLKRLRHLRLQQSNFSGVVPHELGNLTNLRTLDLGFNYELVFKNFTWLSHLSLLSLLDLSSFNLQDTNLLQYILKLPSLTELQLSSCDIPTYFFVNSSSTTLSILDLSHTRLTSSSFHWLFNMSTNLRSIYLSGNYLSVIPDAFGRSTLLEHIDLSYNRLLGGIPNFIGNLSHLQTLILSGNNLSESLLKLDDNQFNGSFPNNFGQFSRLEHLDLSLNHITGPLPDFFPDKFGQFSRLEHLDLSLNQITGSLPDLSALVSLKELLLHNNKLKTLFTKPWQLPKLEILEAGFNSFEGTISDADFSGLHNLKRLYLPFNSLVCNFTVDWIPRFQLQGVSLAYCKMGPRFPAWLQTQTNISVLDLSSVGILGEVPKWLWYLSSSMTYLNLSHNQISGNVPDLSSSFVPAVDISYNNFSGHLPFFRPNSLILQLNNNMFLGSISSICTITYDSLIALDLSNNQFSGELPHCWDNMTALLILNLNNNKFSGHIPHSLGSLSSLQTLHLRDNNFSWGLPSTLKNCTSLSMIDVGGNKLTGKIPAWIGTRLKKLRFLILGHNNFYGRIPPELCYLTEIQVLDLSRNSISGTIPHCFNNFTSLVDKNKTIDSLIFGYGLTHYLVDDFFEHALVQWKGRESEYRRTLGLLKLIDLSSNRLVGNIPSEFSHLRALISLNLSRNYLSGNIISDISEMEMLECIDLSRNQFSGEIPIGFAKLHFLGVLDLSNNNLSGKIPSSGQLQSFNESVYAKNSGLCGPPLPSCLEDGPIPPMAGYEKQDDKYDGIITLGFIISMIFGFIFGFWGVVGTLVVKNSWRNTYFNFFNRMKDWLYVTTTIYVVKLKGNLMATWQPARI